VIVDASVVVKWFSVEALHEEARELLERPEPLFAPDILVADFANAMWIKVKRDEVDASQAARALTAISGRGEPQLLPSVPLAGAAFELAQELAHPVYDCVYLALAHDLDLPLLTADRRFAAAAEGHQRVHLLGR
jgi:predicted nucleic acid-binding protein